MGSSNHNVDFAPPASLEHVENVSIPPAIADRRSVDAPSYAPTLAASSHTDEKTSSAGSSITKVEVEGCQLSTLKLVIIHIVLALCLFLATTDATIVSTSLPTIAAELPGSKNLYSWVGVSYLLTQTAFQPLYGKLADILGRKPVLYGSLLLFMIGSVLCGAAKSMIWLVIARGVAGVGAGGLPVMVWCIMGELVPPRDRAKWSDALSVTWSLSAISGPLLGGLFSEYVTWRWGFYINVPIGFICLVVLRLYLTVPLPGPAVNQGWKATMKTFDYVGLFLLVTGTTALLVGLSNASVRGWQSIDTIVLLCVGGVLLVVAGIYELWTTQDALIPPRLLKNRTTVAILFASFFQTFAYTAGTFYLSLFYQAVNGSSAIMAGIYVLPYTLGSALVSIIASRYIFYTGRYKDMVIGGLGLSTLGFGLMISMNEHSKQLVQELFPLIAGLGMGLLFRSPFVAVEAAMYDQDRAGSTGNFFLVRFIGSCTGLSVAGAIFESQVSRHLPTNFSLDISTVDWRTLVHIQPPELRSQVLMAVSKSISYIWIICTPGLGLSLLFCLFIRNYPIHPATRAKPSDEESADSTE